MKKNYSVNPDTAAQNVRPEEVTDLPVYEDINLKEMNSIELSHNIAYGQVNKTSS